MAREMQVINTEQGQVKLIHEDDIVEGHLWCEHLKKEKMNYFNNDNVALLEFQEGNAKKGKIKLWHYNYGDNKPETYGWRGVLWYNRKNEDACRLVSRFCDCINRTLDDNATYAQVKNLADFFLDMMGKEMKENFLKYNL